MIEDEPPRDTCAIFLFGFMLLVLVVLFVSPSGPPRSGPSDAGRVQEQIQKDNDRREAEHAAREAEEMAEREASAKLHHHKLYGPGSSH